MKQRLLYPILGTIATLLLHFLAGVPWGWAALAAFVGWPLIGTVITIDDDLPGGWSNPDGTRRPEWLLPEFWSQILVGVSIACFVAALEAGWSSQPFVGVAIGGAVAAIAATVLGRRRSHQ